MVREIHKYISPIIKILKGELWEREKGGRGQGRSERKREGGGREGGREEKEKVLAYPISLFCIDRTLPVCEDPKRFDYRCL